MESRRSFLQLIRADFLALDLSVLMAGLWLLYAVSVVTTAHLINPLFWLAAGISTVALPLAVQRIRTLRRLFRYGVQVRARIVAEFTNGSHMKLLECAYRFGEQSFRVSHAFPVATAGRVGTFIYLLVDPLYPHRTVVQPDDQK